MASASVTLPFQRPQQSGGIRSVYDSAATQQAEDYDNIMQGYDSILNDSRKRNVSGANKLNYVPLSPTFTQFSPNPQYQRSGSLNTAITGLEGASRTGGYSDADIGNIRERSISPIRSIYANAQNNLRRQKVLQGGYSPNYGAVSAKLNRDASSQIGDITTKVNAAVAEMIASGKMNALNTLSGTAGRENELMNTMSGRNAELQRENELSNANEQRRTDALNNENIMKVNEINNQRTNDATDDQFKALSGQQSLYGTTPALTNMFANQVLQNNQQNMNAVQTANNLKNQRANIGLNLVNSQLNTPRMGRV